MRGAMSGLAYTYADHPVHAILLTILSAAIQGTVPRAPRFETAYENETVHRVMSAVVGPAGGLSKFESIVLSSTLFGNIAAKGSTTAINFQLLLSSFPGGPQMSLTTRMRR
ncbi:purine-cytosine permease FCY22 [Colletotrichum cuscutae]|uniref:Purine-cytosine permease FCY22 n=1 Tax=Colletotrichum cuscutae TaxID=1209917 RepID=A0AAI9Y819_9PEZI|nr:purine-cytosine permease FCY22 [Colletotrichum cuscutae]